MRRTITAALLSLTLVGAGAAPALSQAPARIAVVAKPCSSGYKHAVIGGEHKCLRRGQFWAKSRDSEYHRYGYHCHSRDSRGNYHLT
jgi:hypothetical protein